MRSSAAPLPVLGLVRDEEARTVARIRLGFVSVPTYTVKALDESTWAAFAALVERNNGNKAPLPRLGKALHMPAQLGHQLVHTIVGVLAAAAFPATVMALATGPIARSKTGEHDPIFRGQCRSTTRALPHATEMAQPADED
jgi:hypothetical protein